MKRCLLLCLCAVLLLVGVLAGPSSVPVPPPRSAERDGDKKDEALPVWQPVPDETPEPEPDPDDEIGALIVYIPDQSMGIEETVHAYFEQQYLAYANLQHVDLSELLCRDEWSTPNLLTWIHQFNQRRRLIWEHDLCYVERGMYEWEITFLEEEDLTDDRMVYWRDDGFIFEEDFVLHFTITGEEGQAYPPIMAVNSQHTMKLRLENGVWKIAFHFFPGSVRKFYWNDDLAYVGEEEMLADLYEEFAALQQPPPLNVPGGAREYDGALAAEYARRYTEANNPAFYRIIDWVGNCANFTSQCVWYGLGGEKMTNDWYGGEGGGTPAWESVNAFWAYATGGNALGAQVLDGVSQLREGDIVQTRSGRAWTPDESEDSFNHMLIVVDADTLLLAQNSPACLVYYSDLLGVRTRLVRPEYLQ